MQNTIIVNINNAWDNCFSLFTGEHFHCHCKDHADEGTEYYIML